MRERGQLKGHCVSRKEVEEGPMQVDRGHSAGPHFHAGPCGAVGILALTLEALVT